MWWLDGLGVAAITLLVTWWLGVGWLRRRRLRRALAHDTRRLVLLGRPDPAALPPAQKRGGRR